MAPTLPPPSPPPPRPPQSPPVPDGYVPVGWTGVPRPPRVDGLAIAALLCGAGGLFCLVTPILGVIFGLVARSRIRSSNGDLTGGGLALAGVIVSALMLAVLALLFAANRLLAAEALATPRSLAISRASGPSRGWR